MLLQGIKAFEYAVVEELLTQLIPDVFDRVELRGVGGKSQQVDVFWRLERIASMPARAVNYHDNALIGVAARNLIEKQLHALGIHVWQYQAIELPGADIHGPVGVGVLVCQHSLAKWAYWLGGPAPAHVRDAPKTGLVLKHQFDGFVFAPVFADFGERFREFFFHSS